MASAKTINPTIPTNIVLKLSKLIRRCPGYLYPIIFCIWLFMLGSFLIFSRSFVVGLGSPNIDFTAARIFLFVNSSISVASSKISQISIYASYIQKISELRRNQLLRLQVLSHYQEHLLALYFYFLQFLKNTG